MSSSSRKKSAPLPAPSDFKALAAQYEEAKRAQRMQKESTAAKTVDPARTSALEQRRQARETARKAVFEKRWMWTAAFWLWLLVMHLAGLFYFTSGFLLTRLVLDNKSSCAERPLPGAVAGSPGKGCWHPKTFNRAVIIVVDALRYDFVVPVDDGAVFHNALPFLYDTALTQPNNAFLRPFIADPPTATLQRLKGLTTGTLPTFVDIGSSFSGTAIAEDNLLAQLRAAGKKMVHLGDDTWNALFPDYFEANMSRAYDSFKVWDLHTVDNGVIEHIFPLLESRGANSKPEWDLLIGHCLGVDHAGHRYGPSHTAMRDKLQEMDAFIRRVAETLDDDTLLVVMGDHGMDAKGDHGGESDDEVEAALWMYSRRPVFGRTNPEFAVPPATAKERPINQIDLVPTLSLLLGIPIPFNNLGWPIEEALIGVRGDDWANLVAAAEITAAGIHRYQKAYFAARGSDIGASVLAPPVVAATMEGKKGQDAFAVLSQYQAETLRICKSLWAQFDLHSMAVGIAIIAASVAVLVLYASRSEDSRGHSDDDEGEDVVDDPNMNRAELLLELQGTGVALSGRQEDVYLKGQQSLHKSMVLAGVLGGLPVLVGGFLWSLLSGSSGSILGVLFASVGFAAVASNLVVAVRLLGVGRRQLSRLVPSSAFGWLAVVFTVAQSIGFASNSYTVWEDSILLFFLATFGLVAAMASLRLPSAGDSALGVYHAVLFVLLGRLASLSRLCREEQMPYCTSTYYASATSSTSAPWQLTIPFVVFLVLPTIVRAFFETTRSYEGLAPMWIGYVFRGGLLMAAMFWMLDAADNGKWLAQVATLPNKFLKSISVYMAQTVLGLALVAGTVAFAWAGPCVSVRAVSASGTNRAQVAVLGYANAHGARYLILPVNLLVALVLLSKPMGVGAMALMMWQMLSLMELLELLRSGEAAVAAVVAAAAEAKATTVVAAAAAAETGMTPTKDAGVSSANSGGALALPPVSAASVRVIGPVVLGMLANFHFFTTGHQATLSSIQWDAAFIPLFNIQYPWSPLVVAGNTFPGHLLAVAAVPLLVLWKTGPQRRGGLLSRTSRALAGFVAYFAVEALATMVWAGHLRRHLMLFRIFNPRFMLAAAVLLLVDVVGLLVTLTSTRSNMISVSDVFGWAEEY